MTIREIAQESEVSITTVSRIINNDFSSVSDNTRKRVQEVIRKNRYVAGQKAKIKTKSTSCSKKRIALIIPEVSQMFFSSIIDEAERQCTGRNKELILCCSRNSIDLEKEHVQYLIDHDVEGILYMSTSTCNENYFGDLKRAGKKFVVLDNNFTDFSLPGAVFVDGEAGIYEMTNYLLRNGHQNIAYFSGVAHCKFNNRRHQGYTRALLEHNIAVDPWLTIFGDFTWASGMESVEKLLRKKKDVTAIICENDLIACGAISELKKHGLSVPDDVSVTGFDNMSISKILVPALTTVDQHIELIVEKAMDLLDQMNRNQGMETNIEKITPDIIYRDSVRCIVEHETMA